MQRGHVALGVEAGGQLALRDRVVAAVRHVLFARPDQLDRRARHLLARSSTAWRDPVVHRAAPAEAAAEVELVDLALRGRQPGRLGRRGQRRLAVLRRRPDLAALRRPARRRVHRLHRRVVLVRVRYDRLDLAQRRRAPARVAVLVADDRLRGVEAGLQRRGDGCARDRCVRAEVPLDRQRIERRLGAPPGVGDDRDGVVADRHDLLDAGTARDRGGVEALDLAAEHRTGLDRRVQHARQLQVHAVDLRAVDLRHGVEPGHALAGDLPVLRVLQRHVGRRRQLRRRFADLAVGRRAVRSACA